jgi:recombinational DNA repair protein (RecF pathway)
VHKAQELSKEEFKREVERHLTGRESEPWELLYFKLYKGQLKVIEQALETAGLMLGSDKSRGYCLEMICADFLAGANLEEDHSEAFRLAVKRLLTMLPEQQRQQIFDQAETRG